MTETLRKLIVAYGESRIAQHDPGAKRRTVELEAKRELAIWEDIEVEVLKIQESVR